MMKQVVVVGPPIKKKVRRNAIRRNVIRRNATQPPIYSLEAYSVLQCLDQLSKQISLEQHEGPWHFGNLVSDTWTADGEDVFPELGLCPHDILGGTGLAVAPSFSHSAYKV